MKVFYKICLSLFFIIFSAGLVSAETLPSMPYIPKVSISNLKLDKDSYRIGDVVTGSFDLVNKESFDVEGINYQVSLVGALDKNGVPNVEYDLGTTTPIAVSPKTKQHVAFKYNLRNAPNDTAAGILLSLVMNNGIELSWKSSPVKIIGGVSILTPVNAFIKFDGKKFELQQGPTVSSDKETNFSVSFFNESKDVYNLHTTMVLQDKSMVDVPDFKPVLSTPVKVLAFSTTTITSVLPTKGLVPGVYLAKFTFSDDKDVSRAPVLYARYIVGGDMVSIVNVTSGTVLPAKAGDTLNVDIAYTGRPLDITSNNSSSTTTANISVVVKNEKNETVLNYNEEKQFGLFGVINISGNINKPAESLTAEVTVTKGGNEILASYKNKIIFSDIYSGKKTNSDGQYVEEVNTPPVKSNKYIFVLYGIAILLFIIAVIVLVVIRKKRLAATLILVGVSLFSYSAHADFIVVSSQNAGVVVDGQEYGRAPVVTGDLSPDILYPGEPYSVSGTIQNWACNNSYSDVNVLGYVTSENVLLSQSDKVSTPFNANHGSYVHSTRFASDRNIKAPTVPDTYSFKLDVTSRMYWDGNVYSGYQSRTFGFFPFTVVSDSINNLSYMCNSGTSTVLSWSPIVPADGYSVVVSDNLKTIRDTVSVSSYQFNSDSEKDYNAIVKPCQGDFCGKATSIVTRCAGECVSNTSRVCSTSDPDKIFDNCGKVVDTCSGGDICSGGMCTKTTVSADKNKNQCNLSASSTAIYDNNGKFVKTCPSGEACFDGYCTSISSLSSDPAKINLRGRVTTNDMSAPWKTASPVANVIVSKGGKLDLDWVVTGSFSGMTCTTNNINSSIGYGGTWTTGVNNETTSYSITCKNAYGTDTKTVKSIVYQTSEY